MEMKGIDVCGYQGEIDFKKVKESGIEFVIIKAGYSESTVDTWEKNFANAKNSGLKVGAYWYSYATTIEQGKREAAAFIKALEHKQLDFPVFMDLEEPEQFRRGKEFCTNLVNAFCGELEGEYYYAGLYGSTYWIENYVDKDTRDSRPVWAADYRGKCYYNGAGIWQYGAEMVTGVQYTCDVDIAYNDYSEYIITNALNNYPDGISYTEKRTNEDIAREIINGEWGNGQERKDRLAAAGYDYNAVQKIVNEILYPPKPTLDELARDVILGKYGNGIERVRRLTEAGYDYNIVQRRVNEMLQD